MRCSGSPAAADRRQAAGGGASGWSDAKIDFSALRSVNARLALSAQRLVYQQIKAGPVTIQATIAGGKLNVQMPTLKLYDGARQRRARGRCERQDIRSQAIRLSLANLDGYSFLKETASFESIDGTAAIALDLTTSGASQRAMVEALAGTAKFEFTDGAIRGINIAKSVRSLSTGILAGWQESAAGEDRFRRARRELQDRQGSGADHRSASSGPLVRMTGAGIVDLPAQTLKFRVDPQVVASLEGQGGKTDLAGLGVPVMIAGPWSQAIDLSRHCRHPAEPASRLRAAQQAQRRSRLAERRRPARQHREHRRRDHPERQDQQERVAAGRDHGSWRADRRPARGAGRRLSPRADPQPACRAGAGRRPAARRSRAGRSPRPSQQVRKAKAKQGAASDDGVSTVKKGKKKQQAAAANPQAKPQPDPALAPEAAAGSSCRTSSAISGVNDLFASWH